MTRLGAAALWITAAWSTWASASPATAQASPVVPSASSEPDASVLPEAAEAPSEETGPREQSDGAPASEPGASTDGAAATAVQRESHVPESASVREARRVIAGARFRFDEGDYGAALAEFLRAHALLAGDAKRQAAVLNNIAVCYERMFRYGLALEYYERYLREGPEDEADRAEVEQVVEGLRRLLGRVRIQSNVPAEAWVGRKLRTQVPAEILVPAGPQLIEVSARGYETYREEILVTPRSEQTLQIVLEPLPQYQGVAPGYFWAGAGVTAAALLTGAGFGIRALREDHKAEQRYDVDPLLVQEKDKRRINRLKLSADISFLSAALFGASSLVLFFLTDWSAEGADQPERVISVVPQIGSSTLALSLAGRLR